jgi:hypothetical protein
MLKLLQEKIGRTLEDTGIGNYFLSKTTIVKDIRTRTDKWDSIKLKSFCTSKESYQKQEKTQRMGEKSLPTTQMIRN